jgi:DNA-binding NarL/FixJ family response regulator
MPELRKDKYNSITKKEESFYEHPEVKLFGDHHWSYIMKLYNMSIREVEVADLVCQGYNNKRISKELEIDIGTVKVHLRNIFRKVRVKSRIILLLKFIDDINKISSR